MLPGTIVTEYAKSGRSSCRKCKKTIGQQAIRFGLYIQSPVFDGTTVTWYHADCFLKMQDVVVGLSELRFDDQKRIRSEFESLLKGLKETGEVMSESGLRVEYAKSGQSMCRGCEEPIQKGLPRLSFLVDGPYGPVPAWHHVDCFVEHCKDKIEPWEHFSGYRSISAEDAVNIKGKLETNAGDSNHPSEEKSETDQKALNDNANSDPKALAKLEKQIKSQSDKLWKVKDYIHSLALGKAAYKDILDLNHILVMAPESKLADIVADCLVFGLAPICPDCSQSRLIWNTEQYSCPINEAWGKCMGSMKLSEIGSFEKLKLPTEIKLKKNLVPNVPLKRAIIERKITKTLDHIEDLKRKNRAQSEEEQLVKITVKGQSTVDPDSELVETHHVYYDKSEDLTYSAMLAASDIATGRNSYYNIQLLEGDWIGTTLTKSKKGGYGSGAYYVFRKWGRVGTNIGDSRLENLASLEDAKEYFLRLYLEKTGNEFGAKFEKKPGLFYPLALTVSDKIKHLEVEPDIKPGEKTNLPLPVQNILRLIFDLDMMRRALIEMEIDIRKMPLGQVSKEQIQKAYSVLSEIESLLQKTTPPKGKLSQLSNQFFTLIPHDFGMGAIPLIDNHEIVKSKLDLLENLTDLEIATRIIGKGSATHADRDPLDVHYESLQCHLSVLNPSSNEFKLIQLYVKTTHAPTHSDYTLDIQQVFVIERDKEKEIFEQYCKENPAIASNRMLLWHGSRISNYIGILSTGLRIAPPEAPSTGYMFGKGIYFADMVSKSANYCCTNSAESTGLMVLSEVALGKMYEKKQSEFIHKLPKGYHSTKGCGETEPSNYADFPMIADASDSDPAVDPVPKRRRTTRRTATAQQKDQIAETSDNPMGPLKCPLGPPRKSDREGGELLYNEYIVYDPRQVRMRYLIQLKFNYKQN